MADVFAQLRQFSAITAGFSEAERAVLMRMAMDNPTAKFILPTPGSEPRLVNGLTTDDVARALREFAEGAKPTKKEIMEASGVNPKSSRDVGKFNKVLEAGVPGLEYRKSQRAEFTVHQIGYTPVEASTDVESEVATNGLND